MIYFRADGNSIIGTGHIMRCLSIADVFKKRGEQVGFILADGSLNRLIEDRGYETIVLDTNHEDMSDEISKMTELISIYRPQFLFIDSYYVTKEYLTTLKRLVKTVYIDDLATFAYPVDILINYNIYAEDIDYDTIYEKENVPLPKLLIGLKYVPLREEFANIEKRYVPEKCSNVLISTGGADPIHLALKLAEYVSQNCNEELTYHFLVGAANTDKEKIESIADSASNIMIHYNVKNMKELICSCDIAVSAAGSTLYEICACGVPIITYVLADNQIKGARAFEAKGLAVNCGDIREYNSPEKIIFESINVLAEKSKQRQDMCTNIGHVVTGFGAEIIADMLM